MYVVGTCTKYTCTNNPYIYSLIDLYQYSVSGNLTCSSITGRKPKVAQLNDNFNTCNGHYSSLHSYRFKAHAWNFKFMTFFFKYNWLVTPPFGEIHEPINQFYGPGHHFISDLCAHQSQKQVLRARASFHVRLMCTSVPKTSLWVRALFHVRLMCT